MLCLSRYTQETICIGDDVKITILGIKGNQVRLGIEAPKTLPVNRQEIHDRIERGEPKKP